MSGRPTRSPEAKEAPERDFRVIVLRPTANALGPLRSSCGGPPFFRPSVAQHGFATKHTRQTVCATAERRGVSQASRHLLCGRGSGRVSRHGAKLRPAGRRARAHNQQMVAIPPTGCGQCQLGKAFRCPAVPGAMWLARSGRSHGGSVSQLQWEVFGELS